MEDQVNALQQSIQLSEVVVLGIIHESQASHSHSPIELPLPRNSHWPICSFSCLSMHQSPKVDSSCFHSCHSLHYHLFEEDASHLIIQTFCNCICSSVHYIGCHIKPSWKKHRGSSIWPSWHVQASSQFPQSCKVYVHRFA